MWDEHWQGRGPRWEFDPVPPKNRGVSAGAPHSSNRRDGQLAIQLFSENGSYNNDGDDVSYSGTASGTADGYGYMLQTREKRSDGVLAARVGLVVSGLVCLAVTPQFALAYQRAYGANEGETVKGWIKQVEWPKWVSGLDAVSTYNRYGIIFGFALAVVVICLGVVVRSRTGKGKWERRGWRIAAGGLGAVAIGSLSEYGIPEDLFVAFGFGLELVGFLLIIVGTPILGWAVRRELGVGRIKAVGVALIGPIGVVAGAAVNGHLPGGPASPIIATAMVIGITGLPHGDHA